MILHRRHRHDGERLVDFVEIHILRRPSGCGQDLRDCTDGRRREERRLLGMCCMRENDGERLEAALLRRGAAHQHQRRRTVRDRARVRGGHGAILAKRRLQRRNLVGRSLGGLLVVADGDLALAARHRHGCNFPREGAVVVRGERARKRRRRKGVLRFARESVGARAFLGEGAHEPSLVVRVFEPVHEHVVDDCLVAHSIAGARLGQEIGRVAHRFHSAGDHDVVRLGSEQVVRDHRRLHRGSAHLVDRRASGRHRNPGFDRRLSRWRLALAGGKHVAHDHFLHVGRLDPRALHSRLDRDGAKIARGKGREIAHQRAHRRAGGAHDDNRIVQHLDFPRQAPGGDLRRGRGTSSPPQFGQMPDIASAHRAQNVHS